MKISPDKKNYILRLGFYILSLLYIIKTITLSRTILHLDKAVGSFHAPIFYFLEFYSYFLFLPILFSLSAVLFFYCGLKIKDRSPLGWLLGMIFSLIVPMSLWFIGKIVIEPTTFIIFGAWWKDYTIITGIILFAALAKETKIFDAEGMPIKKNLRLLLAIFFCLICIPTVCFLFFIHYKIKTRDYDLPKIQSMVNYHIYQPRYLPDERVYETNFFIPKRGLTDEAKTVEINLNYSLSKMMQIRKTGLIIMKQTKLPKETTLGKYVKDIDNSQTKTHPVTIKNKKSLYAVTKSRKTLIIPSQKKTLIVIEGYNITENELIKLANSLY